jgi:hypothetical protein
MNTALSDLISDYLTSVSTAVRLMRDSGLPLPATNTAWAINDIPQSGALQGGIKYYKHGYGCAVHLRGGVVDFDFGANGETTGFDLWRLSSFASDKLPQYGFKDEDALKSAFEHAVAKEEFQYSGYILYYQRKA